VAGAMGIVSIDSKPRLIDSDIHDDGVFFHVRLMHRIALLYRFVHQRCGESQRVCVVHLSAFTLSIHILYAIFPFDFLSFRYPIRFLFHTWPDIDLQTKLVPVLSDLCHCHLQSGDNDISGFDLLDNNYLQDKLANCNMPMSDTGGIVVAD
jgi:hypothetical protein